MYSILSELAPRDAPWVHYTLNKVFRSGMQEETNDRLFESCLKWIILEKNNLHYCLSLLIELSSSNLAPKYDSFGQMMPFLLIPQCSV